MTKSARKWAIIGGLVLGAGRVGGVAYAMTRPPAPKSLGGAGTQLLPGHRYQLTATDPQGTSCSDLNKAQAIPALQNILDQSFGSGMLVVRAVGGAGATATVTFDYHGQQPLAHAQQLDVPQNASITDLGPVS